MNHAVAIETLTECGAAVAALEAEHSAIETAIRSFQAAVVANADDSVILKILDMCVTFCKQHFASEERYMREQGYIYLEAHRAAHSRLLQQFENARAAAASHDAILAMLDGMDLLEAFEEHIRNHDSPMHAMVVDARSQAAA
jgi:hemerythrin-like metal-binding protein